MNANQIINMITRTVIRQLINRGVRTGVNAAVNKMGSQKAHPSKTNAAETHRQS